MFACTVKKKMLQNPLNAAVQTRPIITISYNEHMSDHKISRIYQINGHESATSMYLVNI